MSYNGLPVLTYEFIRTIDCLKVSTQHFVILIQRKVSKNVTELRIEKNCSSIGGHIRFSGDIDNLTGLVAE